MIFINLLFSALVACVAYVLWTLFQSIFRPFFSSLRSIPGPPHSSWFTGNAQELFSAEAGVQLERWIEQYGHVFTFKFAMNSDRLVALDTRAIHHVLTHSLDYGKPERAQRNLARIFGKGLLVVQGEHHRQQRKVMNPAFGPVPLREMTDIFFDKSIQLRDIWLSQMPSSGEPARLDALSWLSRTTLDVIGLAGFGYSFDALNAGEQANELGRAFATIFQGGGNTGTRSTMQMLFGRWMFWTPQYKRIAEARKTMDSIGRELLEEKKKAILDGMDAGGRIEKKAVQGKDLLSLLVKANMAEDIPQSQRLSDEDVLAQVPTFMIAGHETSSTGTTWCLFALSVHPEVQAKLRAELQTVSTDTPDMDQLMGLPYLDAVIREMLRLHSPVPQTSRVALKDDVIPLNKPFVDRYGKTQDAIRISKGDGVLIPIVPINRSKEIWGEDALEFKPERWMTHSIPDAATTIPGIWGNLLTFLGGPRACIGYRFSIVEMKAIIFTLIRAFEVSLAVPPEEIGKKSMIVTRPVVRSDPQKGNQLPLLVKPVKQ